MTSTVSLNPTPALGPISQMGKLRPREAVTHPGIQTRQRQHIPSSPSQPHVRASLTWAPCSGRGTWPDGGPSALERSALTQNLQEPCSHHHKPSQEGPPFSPYVLGQKMHQGADKEKAGGGLCGLGALAALTRGRRIEGNGQREASVCGGGGREVIVYK